MGGAGALAFVVGGAAVVDIGLVGIMAGLFDQGVSAVGTAQQS